MPKTDDPTQLFSRALVERPVISKATRYVQGTLVIGFRRRGVEVSVHRVSATPLSFSAKLDCTVCGKLVVVTESAAPAMAKYLAIRALRSLLDAHEITEEHRAAVRDKRERERSAAATRTPKTPSDAPTAAVTVEVSNTSAATPTAAPTTEAPDAVAN